ncbi:hypothetical protein CFOL_v3_00137 [Cephalotus follicularis]|uniref:Uncharacterized protein n=1 Tax=Cephalotus follicularis TaxID=3775 RepID=A0A1Q3ALQ5_CEPFO|nr:hypothetical protein CFOL_v3_00137 [Cephalotus follicularis]
MDISASQCGSGCESGWTLYLDQSSLSKDQCHGLGGFVNEDYYEGKGTRIVEEEDLSMVSDASSGPRHYFDDDEDYFDENGCFSTAPSASESAENSKKKKKTKEHGKANHQHSYLDDTASSPINKKNVNTTSKNEPPMEHVDFSQGFSATHFKGKSPVHKHYGFLQSSLADKSVSQKHGGFQGRNWT